MGLFSPKRITSHAKDMKLGNYQNNKVSILDELVNSKQKYEEVDYSDNSLVADINKGNVENQNLNEQSQVSFSNENKATSSETMSSGETSTTSSQIDTSNISFAEAAKKSFQEGISYNDAKIKIAEERKAELEKEKKRRAEISKAYQEWHDSLEFRVKNLEVGSLEYRNTVLQYRIEKAGGLGTRNAVVAAALYLSEEENIPYFWGGKSSEMGVNADWNEYKKIVCSGSDAQPLGQSCLYGLDCSGFTNWAIINGGFQIDALGTGAFPAYSTQYNFTADNLKNGIIKAGDLLYRNGHIAIITDLDLEKGTIKVAEEKGAAYGMVVTEKSIDDYVAGEHFTSILSMEDFYNNPENLQESVAVQMNEKIDTEKPETQEIEVNEEEVNIENDDVVEATNHEIGSAETLPTKTGLEDLTDEQIDAVRKIFFAIETGGQVYGNARYDSVIGAYTNSPNETAITVGAGQWFGNQARDLLIDIQKTNPTAFSVLDTAGLAEDLLSDWSNYNISPTSTKGQCIAQIISSDIGIIAQNKRIEMQIGEYFTEAEEHGITDLGAKVMYAEMKHCGGTGAAERILSHASKPYTAASLYAAVTSVWPDDAGKSSPINSDLYRSRHDHVYEWVNEHVLGNTNEEIVETEEPISMIPRTDENSIDNYVNPTEESSSSPSQSLETSDTNLSNVSPSTVNTNDINYRNDMLHSEVSKAGFGTRQAVVAAATYLSENEKIPFFWGGKSPEMGINEEWNKDKIITNGGSEFQPLGTTQSYGLDSSGFVNWAVNNGGYNFSALGSERFTDYGTQYSFNATNLKSGTIKAGDLLYRNGHVAIITGLDLNAGTIKVAEEVGPIGMVVTEKSIDEYCDDNEYKSIISMENFYNNSNNVNEDVVASSSTNENDNLVQIVSND